MNPKFRKALIWGIPLLILILLGIFFAWKHSAKDGKVTSNLPEFSFEEEQVQQTEAASQTRGIKIPGYTVIPIAANSQEVEVDLYNPEENQVYFQISFVLKDSGEKIFESKLIKPGQHLYTISLTQPLAPGDHDITIQYATFSTDGAFSPRNGASVDCVLRAEE